MGHAEDRARAARGQGAPGTLAPFSARVQEARKRIAEHLAPTPVRKALAIDPSGGLTLKMESFQPTGSFKVRGAMNRILGLTGAERERGVIAASTGNHGAAVAYAASLLGVEAEVVIPEPTPEGRATAISSRGAMVRRHGQECGEAEAHARALSEADGRTFISPYNDVTVMAGQGTIGAELLDQVEGLRRVYVAVGGGGLIGGIAAAIKAARPDVEIIGCSPAASYPMHASAAAGEIVDTPHLDTLSVATAGALEADAVTLLPCRAGVDRWILVDEESIARGVLDLLLQERLMVEGAVGVALAGWRVDHAEGRVKDGQSAVVVCGGNLDGVHLRAVLATEGGAQ